MAPSNVKSVERWLALEMETALVTTNVPVPLTPPMEQPHTMLLSRRTPPPWMSKAPRPVWPLYQLPPPILSVPSPVFVIVLSWKLKFPPPLPAEPVLATSVEPAATSQVWSPPRYRFIM